MTTPTCVVCATPVIRLVAGTVCGTYVLRHDMWVHEEQGAQFSPRPHAPIVVPRKSRRRAAEVDAADARNRARNKAVAK